MRLKEYDSGLRRDVSLDRPNLTDDIMRPKDVWADQLDKKCNNGLGCYNHEVCGPHIIWLFLFLCIYHLVVVVFVSGTNDLLMHSRR